MTPFAGAVWSVSRHSPRACQVTAHLEAKTLYSRIWRRQLGCKDVTIATSATADNGGYRNYFWAPPVRRAEWKDTGFTSAWKARSASARCFSSHSLRRRASSPKKCNPTNVQKLTIVKSEERLHHRHPTRHTCGIGSKGPHYKELVDPEYLCVEP